MYDSWVAWCRTQSRRNLHRFYGRAQKSWDPFDECVSQHLRSVMQTSQKTKVRRSEKFKSKFLISAVRTLWNLRIDLRRRLKDRCDDAWRLAKKETGKATFFSPTNEWCLPAPSVINPEEREFVADSGASMHMLSRKDLNSAELETVSLWKSDDGCHSQRRSANQRRSDSVSQRIGFIRDGKASRRYTGRSLTRKSLRRPRIFLPLDQWPETTTEQRWQRRIKCNTANYVPIVVPGLSTGSSSSATPTSPTSLSQESASRTLRPAPTRSESTRSTVWVSPSHEPPGIEK